jgi:pyridoxine 5-phosphate synthase
LACQIRNDYPPARLPLGCQRLQKEADWLLTQCGMADWQMAVRLVDDQEMARLNRVYRQQDKPTNVLAFALADGIDPSLAGLPFQELGDVVISVDTARREALLHRQSLTERLRRLLIHGLLHLLGMDHERSAEEEQKMLSRENLLLGRLENYRRTMMTTLAVNVDHIATIRQARGGREPDPVTAAAICELAGAAGIVVHLREDRRHIQDRDVFLLRETVQTRLNLEMGANKEIIAIALELRPDIITLVPEKREELTTEGGLDVASQKKKIAKVIEKMTKAGIAVSIFADPDPKQLQAAQEVGATFVELHTGRYSDATSEEEQLHELRLIAEAAQIAGQAGLRVCAGHGLNYRNTAAVAALENIEELSIGHAIISRAALTGLDQAVREMLTIVQRGAQLL